MIDVSRERRKFQVLKAIDNIFNMEIDITMLVRVMALSNNDKMFGKGYCQMSLLNNVIHAGHFS